MKVVGAHFALPSVIFSDMYFRLYRGCNLSVARVAPLIFKQPAGTRPVLEIETINLVQLYIGMIESLDGKMPIFRDLQLMFSSQAFNNNLYARIIDRGF